MNLEQHDCLILGGGVVGLSLAYELAQRNRQVTVLEQRRAGRAASWAGAGILPPPLRQHVVDPLDQLRTLSHEMHLEWAEKLRRETNIDNGLRRCGGLYLATSPGEAAALMGLGGYFDAHGVESRRIDMNELETMEPALRPAIASDTIRAALHCADELQLRNPRHLQALQAACRTRGVEIVEQQPVTKLTKTADGEIEAQSLQATYRAQAICVAAGAWSLDLLTSIRLNNGIYPVRGQMVLYRCSSPPFQHILNEGPRYLVPRDDGYVLAGSSEEEVGFDENTSAAVIENLMQFAANLVPELSEDRVETSWAGLRPASFDGFPYIGRVDDAPNLYVAAGHFRSGLHLSTGTARVVAQLVCGESSPIDLSPFSPTRG